MGERYSLLNTYVDALTMEETIRRIETAVLNREKMQHVVINAGKINLMRKDPELLKIVNSCPLINADGASIIWAARQFKIPLKERVTGIDLFQNLIELANRKGYSIYLFGAREDVVLKVQTVLRQQYPSLKIAGYRNGYFTENDEQDMIPQMAASGADMMFVAFSSPKKEYWIRDHIDDLNIPFIMGVGGSFDVLAGVTTRAPLWMQKHGLEWFYRFIQEPIRMWKRYIVGNFSFVAYVQKLKREQKRKRKSERND